jgi:hypothetical protein
VLGRCRSLQRSSSGQMFGAGNGVVFFLERFFFLSLLRRKLV